MNTITHKTRLEIIKNNNIVKTVEPSNSKSNDDCNISTNNSVNSFPTLSVKSSNPDVNSFFMDFSKFDIIRLSLSAPPNNQYINLFEGEFSKKTIKFEKKTNQLTLDIEAIHSFFRLSMLKLTSTQEFTGITFQEFVSKLVTMAEINSKITISEELSREKITGLSKNTNAFRLFKEICLIVDAGVTFNTNNTVEIDYRQNKLIKLRSSQVTKITETDIISVETKDSI
jgi:hypothetical protein